MSLPLPTHDTSAVAVQNRCYRVIPKLYFPLKRMHVFTWWLLPQKAKSETTVALEAVHRAIVLPSPPNSSHAHKLHPSPFPACTQHSASPAGYPGPSGQSHFCAWQPARLDPAPHSYSFARPKRAERLNYSSVIRDDKRPLTSSSWPRPRPWPQGSVACRWRWRCGLGLPWDRCTCSLLKSHPQPISPVLTHLGASLPSSRPEVKQVG
ncbi:uncharacterized protein LOC114009748 [Tupaia chinensis]|uniref:uncharacterized protein LOC114009748 n=1 Tax=Tupaia chinensis TaxID=246437 RepID=UPI000FFC79D6|nr:uncharacterized protein LOC114009748 [Tupaia chinensis]